MSKKLDRATLRRCVGLCREVGQRGDVLDEPLVLAAIHNEGEAEACAVAIEVLLLEEKSDDRG